jgi:hypothetical protein
LSDETAIGVHLCAGHWLGDVSHDEMDVVGLAPFFIQVGEFLGLLFLLRPWTMVSVSSCLREV